MRDYLKFKLGQFIQAAQLCFEWFRIYCAPWAQIRAELRRGGVHPDLIPIICGYCDKQLRKSESEGYDYDSALSVLAHKWAHDILMYGFNWHSTAEGSEFWSGVYADALKRWQSNLKEGV
jgi:hypothetical protein